MEEKLPGKRLASVTLCVQTVTNKELTKENSVLVDNNFLSKEETADVMSRVLLHGLDIPWTLAYNTDIPIDNVEATSSYQFSAGLFYGMPAYEYFLKVFDRFCHKHHIKCDGITRMKLNWLPRSANGLSDIPHLPHVDSTDKHKVFLYYVNDSDGDTVFFNELFDGTKKDQFTESQRVSPEAGKGVVFDGHIYHASSSPIASEYRCILNVDFI